MVTELIFELLLHKAKFLRGFLSGYAVAVVNSNANDDHKMFKNVCLILRFCYELI